jgi:hypothetical protein
MNKNESTSGLGYIGYAGLFILEVVLIPYYMIESAYYRSKDRMNNFYRRFPDKSL